MHPADGENTDVRWFHRDELPSLSPDMAERVEAALANQPEARFRGGAATHSR